MSTFAYILIVAGCALIALWLVLAACFGIGVFWDRRVSWNETRQSVARRFGLASKPINRRQWALLTILSVPFLLFGAAVVLIHFFASLLVEGWYRLTGKPHPQKGSLHDMDDDSLVQRAQCMDTNVTHNDFIFTVTFEERQWPWAVGVALTITILVVLLVRSRRRKTN